MWGLLSPYGLRSHDNHVQDTLAAEPDALPAHQSDDLDEESHFIGSLGSPHVDHSAWDANIWATGGEWIYWLFWSLLKLGVYSRFTVL